MTLRNLTIRVGCGLLPIPAAVAHAQDAAPPPPAILSLSEAQRADLLAHNTEDSVAQARSGLAGGSPARQIHGEFGAFVGTHGERGAYGAAAVPLGDRGQAAVSFEDSRYGRPR